MLPRIHVLLRTRGAKVMGRDSSFLIWIAIFCGVIALAFTKEVLLPDYFFFDSYTLERMLRSAPSLTRSDSYLSTAAVYKLLGVTDRQVGVPAISVFFVVAFFVRILKSCKQEKIKVFELVIFIYFAILSSIYLTTFSKDLVVLFLIIGFVFLEKRGKLGLLAWTGLALFYAYYFRAYWLLFVCQFWIFYLVLAFARRPLLVILALPVSLLMFAIAIYLFLGIGLDYYRVSVNDVRLDAAVTNARTMITPWISGSGFFIGWINVCLTLVSLFFPFPLLSFASLYYYIIFLMISFTYFKLYSGMKLILENRNNTTLKNYLALLLAFVSIQAVFEPDYGSYVRHLTPFYPIFFALIVLPRHNRAK